MRLPRSLGAALALSTGATLGLAAVGTPAHADPVPAPYAARATGEIVQVEATLAGQELADVGVGYSTADADSTRASRDTHARAANVDPALLGTGITLDGVEVFAAPSSSRTDRIPAVAAAPLLELGVIDAAARADYVGDAACPLASGATRLLSQAATKLATAKVLPGTPVGDVVAIGASSTTSTTAIAGTSVVSRATSEIGDISLFGGQIQIHVTDPVTLTATSNGSTGSMSYDNPTVTVTIAGESHTLSDPGATLPLTIPDLVSGSLTLLEATDSSAGATGAGSLPAVLKLDLTVRPADTPVAHVVLGVSPLSVAAKAPASGVQCDVDSDGDGLSNDEEVEHGTRPDDADTDNDGLNDGQEVNTYGTKPLDPDTDDDGLTDGQEVKVHGTKPRFADTDGDGLKDGKEVKGFKIRSKVAKAKGWNKGPKRLSPVVYSVRTNPKSVDTDRDGLTDRQEATGSRNSRYGRCATNPVKADTDRDRLKDGREVKRHRTNPCHWDTDRGGVSDGREVRAGSNPLKKASTPWNP